MDRVSWMSIGAAALALALAASHADGRAGDDPIQFVVIQPGAPGSTEEAAPVMARLAEYLAAHVPDRPIVKGRYVNTLADAGQAIRTLKPRVGIVTLPYYLEQRGRYNLRPLLATRPDGRSNDRYRLLVASNNPAANWTRLTGDVAGTLCHTPDAVARLMFGRAGAAQLPFRCLPTDRLLRSIRQVAGGALAGVLVNAEQYRSLDALPEGKQVKALHETGSLPPSLVVSFGPVDASAPALANALEAMKGNPAAAELLKELRTDGFAPVDAAALETLQAAFDKAGKRP